jgi:NAD(P)-dependent dehydrogenase (short-subunit alcohol dehydrogenase family)
LLLLHSHRIIRHAVCREDAHHSRCVHPDTIIRHRKFSLEIILRLKGRRIVITGAASGIGRATAELFAREGAAVAVLDMNQAGAVATAKAVSGFAIAVDVRKEDSVNQAVEKAAAAMGGIDGLVNAAGVAFHSLIKDTGLSDWQKVIDINLTGPFLMCRAAMPWLLKAESATIVNIASGAALLPFAGSSAYAASKAGLLNFNRVLAKELAPTVRANVICPGIVDTPMLTALEQDRDPKVKAASADLYALKRKAQPEEIAAAILFLTSAESSFVTGTTLAVDGGRTFH